MGKNLSDLRMHGSCRPFCAARDDVNDRLREVHALLYVVEQAFRTAVDVGTDENVSTIADVNPGIVADAIEGIGTLVALTQHHYDMTFEERAQPAAVAA